MRYLTNIDMNQNELQNAVFQNSDVAPANPKIGQMYTDISGKEPVMKWWNGTKWIPLGAAAPDKNPNKVEPSVSIKVSDIDTSGMEVGTTVPVSFEAKFNPGSYTYGPETGVAVSSWRIYDTDGNSTSNPSDMFADVTVGDETAYKITAEATHTAGAVPLTEQGNQYPSAQIQAGTKSASTGSIKGYRKYFYGTSTTISAVNSGLIRSLTNSTSPIKSGTSFDLDIPNGTNQVIIAFPSSAGLTLSEVIDTGAFNINVYDIFRMENVDVEGANGYEAVSYDVYIYTPDISLSKNKYKVTIS